MARKDCAIVAVVGLLVAGCTALAPSAPGGSTTGGAAPTGLRTLPPAWTATPSPSPRPPTATPTATPIGSREYRAASGSVISLPPFEVIAASAEAPDWSGWVEVELEHASFWLPPSYEVADLGEFGELMELLMVGLMEGLAEGFSDLAPTGAPGPTPTPLSLDELREAFDFEFVMAGEADAQAAVFVIGEPVEADADLVEALEQALDGIASDFEVVSRQIILDPRYAVGRNRIRFTPTEGGSAGMQLQYVILHGGRKWTLSYQTTEQGFAERASVFERSASSFTPRAAGE